MSSKGLKREPLLVDRFIALGPDPVSSAVVNRQYYETTRAHLLAAKRFVLDARATEYCAEMIREAPRIIADAQDFAIPPFERTYIEIPYKVWYEAITGKPAAIDSDSRVGYLIIKNVVRIITEAEQGSGAHAGVFPIQYELHNPFTIEEETQLAARLGVSRILFDLFYWGGSAAKLGVVNCLKAGLGSDDKHTLTFDNEWEKEGLRALRANHRFSLHWRYKNNEAEKFEKLYQGSAGDLRNIIALLLFLNRTSKLRVEEDVPTMQGRHYGLRYVPLLRHRTITLHVNPLPHLMRLVAGDGIRRRLHDVRGHFCHNRIARENDHDHEWEESIEHDLQWYCGCGGMRWWRREHKRGFEDKGVVTSEYKVTE